MATLVDITRWQMEAEKMKSTTIDAMIELVAAAEAVGEFTRYWPREMRLDGSDMRLEKAIDEVTKIIKAVLGERE